MSRLRRALGSIVFLVLIPACRAPAEATTDPHPVPATEPAVTTAPDTSLPSFGVILRTRGGTVEQERYDYELHSDGYSALRLHRKLGTQLVEVTLDEAAIERVRKVLAASPLWTAEGEYGGDAGKGSSAKFHVLRRSIDLLRPGERRRIEFPRIYAWKDFEPVHQAVLIEFVDLWAAVEATIPDERLRDFAQSSAPMVEELVRLQSGG